MSQGSSPFTVDPQTLLHLKAALIDFRLRTRACPECGRDKWRACAWTSGGPEKRADGMTKQNTFGSPLTSPGAVPVQRDRRSMSRRPGQNGRVEKRGDTFSFLFYRDIPGTTKRQRVRRRLKATTMVAAKQEAQRIMDSEGINTSAHLEASRDPVVTFGVAAELWKTQQLHANGKASSKRTMGCELERHVLPNLKDTPVQEITYPAIRGLVQAWRKEGLCNKSMRNLFGIVRAVYNFYLDETAQHGKTNMLPWLIKWSKVAPTASVEEDAACFTPEQMAAIV